MKKVLEKFNHRDTLLVITSFPNPTNGKYGKRDFNAIAWHSEKTLLEMSKNRKVLVLAEKTRKRDRSFYVNKNLFINRLWSKKSNMSILHIAWKSIQLSNVKTVFIPFEFNLLGGTFHNLLLLLILFILRLDKKNVVVEIHQVIEDLKELEKHINITNTLIQKIYNLSLKIYYFLFGKLANNIIVFEEELKNRLKKYIDENKINVFSLATQKKKIAGQTYARKKLGLPEKDFLAMVFGYINGYKGIDFIIDAFSQVKNKNIKLVIAGGKNPYLKGKKFYDKFYSKIMNKARTNKKIIVTGFIPDAKVDHYFSAVDLIVLPYEVFISASGPFSLALSYKKPTILSEKLSPYQQSPDFKMAMKEANLKVKNIFFPLKRNAVMSLIKSVKNNNDVSRKLSLFSQKLVNERILDTILTRYEKLFSPNLNLVATDANKKVLKLAYE